MSELGPLRATCRPPEGRVVVDVTVAAAAAGGAGFVASRGGTAAVVGAAVLGLVAAVWGLAAVMRPRRVDVHEDGVVVVRPTSRDTVYWSDVAEVALRRPGGEDAQADVLVLQLKSGRAVAFAQRSIGGFDVLRKAAFERAPADAKRVRPS